MVRISLLALALATLSGCNNSSSVALNSSEDQESNSDGTSSTTEVIPPPPETQASESCLLTASLGNAFQSASGAQSDPVFSTANALDGCADTASSWSGNQAESLVLDAGSLQNIQGIYLWMSYQRAEWLSIEQSADGEDWNQSWRRIQNLADAEHTYFSLDSDSPSRYVRITGYGSDDNAWTNIAEARWSLSGESIETDRVWKYNDQLVALHSGNERAVSPLYQRPLSSMFISCPYLGSPVYVDATGTRDSFWQFQEVGDVLVYSFDWDHYPRFAEPDFFGAPLITYEPMRHAQALLEPLAADDPLVLLPSDCATTVVSDTLHIIDDMLFQADAGLMESTGWK